MGSQTTNPVSSWGPIPAAPPFPVLESKLTPPLERDRESSPGSTSWTGWRPPLPRRWSPSARPPGTARRSLAAGWAERDRRPFVWLSIDEHDNDPAVLLTYLAVGLDRVEPIDPAVLGALASRGASITQTVLPRLGAALSSKALPVVMVLDDVHLLHDQEGLDAVAGLVDHLPQGSQLAMISRDQPPFPMARWRAEGRLAELGPGELAMDPVEAGLLLRLPGSSWPMARWPSCTRRTEGWPVALYLAALSIKAQRPWNGAGVGLSGRDGSWSTTSSRRCWRACPHRGLGSLSGPRCWIACRGRCATPCSAPPGRRRSLRRLSGPTCWSSRWIASGSSTAPSAVPGAAAWAAGASRARAGGRAHPSGGPLVQAPRAGRGRDRLRHGRR